MVQPRQPRHSLCFTQPGPPPAFTAADVADVQVALSAQPASQPTSRQSAVSYAFLVSARSGVPAPCGQLLSAGAAAGTPNCELDATQQVSGTARGRECPARVYAVPTA